MKSFYIILPAFVFLAACGKDSTPVVTPTPVVIVDTLKYSVTGFQTVVLQPTDSADMHLQLKRSAGKKEEISVALISLPAGVSVSLAPQVDTPDFNIDFRFYSSKAKTGTFPIQLITHGNISGTKYYNFSITVRPYINEVLNIIGFYKEAGNCTVNGALNHNISITEQVSAPNRININDLWLTNGQFNIYADLDTVNKTVSIPAQVANGMNFQGTGTYTYTQMSIQYKINGTAVNDSCTTVLTKQ